MSSSARSRRVRYALVAVLLLGGAFAVWWFAFRTVAPKGDAVAATAANSRGIGQMEQFEYEKAEAAFAEAAKLAPDWLPARINLGMAIYNRAGDVADPVLPRAVAVFEQVLAEDPKNPYAHFNLGIIRKYTGDFDRAFGHFKTVTELDPTDDRAWLYLAQSLPNRADSPDAKRYFERALELNPALAQAFYGLSVHSLTTAEEQAKLQDTFTQLQQANWEDEARSERHSEQGRYATCIGKGLVPPPAVGPPPVFAQTPAFPVAGDVKWDTGERKKTTAFDPLLDAVRARFGGVMVRLDFNRDGKPDLLLLSAAFRDGTLSDVLLRNDGDKFTDVSAAMGLTGASLACAVGDYDNDTWPDLLLTTETGVKLLRNANGAKFEDKTKDAGFDRITGVFLSAMWLDLDQDGDLDLVLGRYATDAAKAVDQLTKGTAGDGKVLVLQNVGVAEPSRADVPPPPLTTAFRPLEIPAFQVSGAVSGLVALDIDGDKDVDLVVLLDGLPPVVILNDRLMRFTVSPSVPTDAKTLTAGLILDANTDEQSDLFFLSTGKPVFLVSKKELPDADLANRFAAGATDAPVLLGAHRCDLDNDGRADVLGLSKDGKPVFLQGDGAGKLAAKADAFGPAVERIAGLKAVAATDLNGDGNPDLILWGRDGLTVFVNAGNGNGGIKLQLTGKRDSSNAGSGQKNLRTNTDGTGVKLQTLTGSLSSMVELTTLSAGPGQSLLPVEIGVGKATQADTIRLRWPDCVVQAELAAKAGQVTVIEEYNRKPTSCPVLMTWDGEKWVYVTDFLGGGALGESGPDGSVKLPRPEESVKIEAHQLKPKNGRYVLRIAEPMDEVMYLDHVRLDVVDHPADTVVFPDERFAVADPQPTQKLLAFKTRLFPVKATDHTGKDVTRTLQDRDGKTVDGFAKRTWMGYAEEHFVELDFGAKLKELPADKPVYLVAAGWTDYPYPESILAATQAGIAMLPPVLERQTPDGKWVKLGDLGFPAGLPKVMTVPVGDWLTAGTGAKFRIRTNLQVYWDQLFLGVAETPATVHELPPVAAALSNPGFVQEITTGGKPPQAYDPNRFEAVAVTKWKGAFTKVGDVTELMSKVDDRFVLCGPGQEVTVTFDAAKLPPLKDGWVRSFVLRTHGYCKDTAPTTVTGGEVGPLPFRGMTAYPPPARGR